MQPRTRKERAVVVLTVLFSAESRNRDESWGTKTIVAVARQTI